ncbi:11187_t:CDS:1, partial [Funneliformis caledonium]
NEEDNINIKKIAYKELYEEKYQEYILNSPAEFEGSVRPDITAKELFSETVKTKFRLKSLSIAKHDNLKNYLHTHTT